MGRRELAYALVVGLSLACSRPRPEAVHDTPCHSDVDCAAGQTCHLPDKLKIVAPPRPCLKQTPCTSSSGCSDGFVCVVNELATSSAIPDAACAAMVCVQVCQTAGCRLDEVCAASGACELRPCDEADAPACADRYRCDSSAATAPLALFVGSDVIETADPKREAARGCVRKKCDEDEGFSCQPLWSCSPDASAVGESGCVADPCEETGHCADDERYICNSDNAWPRPEGSDAHGCVRRNCNDGAACDYPLAGTCTPTHPRADLLGCFISNCEEEPDRCSGATVCDRTAFSADIVGCRQPYCDEPSGVPCRPSYICDPNVGKADSSGCRAARCDDPGGPSCGLKALCEPKASDANSLGCRPAPPEGEAGAAGSSGETPLGVCRAAP